MLSAEWNGLTSAMVSGKNFKDSSILEVKGSEKEIETLKRGSIKATNARRFCTKVNYSVIELTRSILAAHYLIDQANKR